MSGRAEPSNGLKYAVMQLNNIFCKYKVYSVKKKLNKKFEATRIKIDITGLQAFKDGQLFRQDKIELY